MNSEPLALALGISISAVAAVILQTRGRNRDTQQATELVAEHLTDSASPSLESILTASQRSDEGAAVTASKELECRPDSRTDESGTYSHRPGSTHEMGSVEPRPFSYEESFTVEQDSFVQDCGVTYRNHSVPWAMAMGQSPQPTLAVSVAVAVQKAAPQPHRMGARGGKSAECDTIPVRGEHTQDYSEGPRPVHPTLLAHTPPLAPTGSNSDGGIKGITLARAGAHEQPPTAAEGPVAVASIDSMQTLSISMASPASVSASDIIHLALALLGRSGSVSGGRRAVRVHRRAMTRQFLRWSDAASVVKRKGCTDVECIWVSRTLCIASVCVQPPRRQMAIPRSGSGSIAASSPRSGRGRGVRRCQSSKGRSDLHSGTPSQSKHCETRPHLSVGRSKATDVQVRNTPVMIEDQYGLPVAGPGPLFDAIVDAYRNAGGATASAIYRDGFLGESADVILACPGLSPPPQSVRDVESTCQALVASQGRRSAISVGVGPLGYVVFVVSVAIVRAIEQRLVAFPIMDCELEGLARAIMPLLRKIML